MRGAIEPKERKLAAYESHPREFLKCPTRQGTNPDTLEGHAHDTAKIYANVLDKFHRWAWVHGGGYTLDLTHDEAETYLRNMVLSEEDYSTSYLDNIKLALKAYFRFRDRPFSVRKRPRLRDRIRKARMPSTLGTIA